jgi:hypothetical protein
MQYIDESQPDYQEYNPDAIYDRDVIANVRTLVSSVRSVTSPSQLY